MEIEDITKEEVEAYERVRSSGKWNMLMDAASAMRDMKLNPRHKSDIDKYMAIVKNYGELMKKFSIERK